MEKEANRDVLGITFNLWSWMGVVWGRNKGGKESQMRGREKGGIEESPLVQLVRVIPVDGILMFVDVSNDLSLRDPSVMETRKKDQDT